MDWTGSQGQANLKGEAEQQQLVAKLVETNAANQADASCRVLGLEARILQAEQEQAAERQLHQVKQTVREMQGARL